MNKIILTIKNMHCSSCSLLIDTVLEELPGVKSSKTSLAKKQTTIEYDPSQITPQQMIEVVHKEGYDATI